MTRLQIYTESTEGPSIYFEMNCIKCKYFVEENHCDIDHCYIERSCLKLHRKLKSLITPNDCPLLNTQKANVILDAIENYVKI